MTKKILILAYILAVLALSGMVKAKDISEDQFNLNQSTVSPGGILKVQGNIHRICSTSKPGLVVSNIDESAQIVEFAIEAANVRRGCDLTAEKPFRISFDLKELPLRPGQKYSIEFASAQNRAKGPIYKALIPPSGLDGYRYNKQELRGNLVSINDGFVLQRGNLAIPVVSPDFTSELADFLDDEVTVTGYVVRLAALANGDENLAQGSQVEKIIVPISVSQ